MPPRPAEHAADEADEGVEAAAARLDARRIANRQPVEAIERQQRPDREPEAQGIGVVQQEHADRHAERAADDQRRDAAKIETGAHRSQARHLAEQRAEHRQRRGDLRRQRPGPQAHRDEREGEAGNPLDEARQGRAERHRADHQRRNRASRPALSHAGAALQRGFADRAQGRRRRDRLRVDLHVQDRRLARLQRAREGGQELRGLLDRFAVAAERARKGGEIGIAQLRSR